MRDLGLFHRNIFCIIIAPVGNFVRNAVNISIQLALIVGIAENVMNLLNIQAFYQYVVRGFILMLAVLLDNLRSSTIAFRS